MNKPVFLGLSILDKSKSKMYDFSYDYIKPKYGKKVKLCYIDTDSFIAMYKQKIFTKILLQMLKKGQTLQIIRQIHPCLWEKIKKSYRVNER